MSDAVMVPRVDPNTIWLEPSCCADPSHGRQWCEDDAFPVCEDGREPVKYIRADLAASPSVGGWEDISTAPKTDEANMVAVPFIGWCPEPEADGGGDQRICWWEPKTRGGQWWSDRDLPEKPTFWTALPPPPSVSTGSRPQEAILPQTEKGS